ncbi:hypothetical protein C0Q70_01655 [Pomacea canaliculata]|uniref:MARVEL domain-containing protein n=1 Tax=Pomacea canaliculata TaxID=400727 RepID=A0A2T7Q031_POMCA|nr:hypothetical protein C0Q70_01655 [Pomacea canaliculata]
MTLVVVCCPIADWFEAVRALECLAVIIYFTACVVAMYDNCLAEYDPCTPPSRRVEVVTCVAGMTGVAGLVIYSVMMDINRSADYVFGWSHTLTSAGLSTAFLVVILMAVTNRVSIPVPQVDSAVMGTEETLVMSYRFTEPAASPLHRPGAPYQSRPDHKCQQSGTSASCVSSQCQPSSAQPLIRGKEPAKNGWKPKSHCYQT